MKKILLGSAVLTLFAISITIFQISCQKESQAQTTNYTLTPATTTTLGGVIVGNGLSVTSNGTLSVNATSGGVTQLNKIIYTKFNSSIPQKFEIWTANYDGTDQTKLNITMPAGYQCAGDGEVKLSPDGQKVFFTSLQFSTSTTHIFACNIDGSNLTKIIDGTSAGTEGLFLGAAY